MTREDDATEIADEDDLYRGGQGRSAAEIGRDAQIVAIVAVVGCVTIFFYAIAWIVTAGVRA